MVNNLLEKQWFSFQNNKLILPQGPKMVWDIYYNILFLLY